ncbi:CAP domain-containing protein [Corynebacterium choanae]|uniref:Cysteine-rich secretory protein family protein n=1 Tax=Corynebacterium choanae TaxID=1862358 RepID=A0A3G6J4W0_9CORY|nr:CAP domain-containing protein [Corynebacterium choanae]AZA13131.1 Cysteine-rich secretory protein family protein [Corynebacterium choanae]
MITLKIRRNSRRSRRATLLALALASTSLTTTAHQAHAQPAQPAAYAAAQPQPISPIILGLGAAVGLAAVLAVVLQQSSPTTGETSGTVPRANHPSTPSNAGVLAGTPAQTGPSVIEIELGNNDGLRDTPTAGLEGLSEQQAAEHILQEINEARQQLDRPALAEDTYLATSATEWATQIGQAVAEQGSLDADSFHREGPEAWNVRPTGGNRDGSRHGYEFVARDTSRHAPQLQFERWLRDSSNIRQQLLSDDFTHAGIGVYRDPLSGEWFFDIRLRG